MKLCFNEATTLKNSTLEQDLVLCEKAGFDYIEIWICQLEKYLQHNKLDDLISFFAKSTALHSQKGSGCVIIPVAEHPMLCHGRQTCCPDILI